MAGPHPIRAVSHISLCVRDLDRSLRFYRDLLGLRQTKDDLEDTRGGPLPHLYRDAHDRRRVVYLRFGDDDATEPFLVLTEHPGDLISGDPILLDQVGISHFSFTVPDVAAITDRLLAAGAETCGPPDSWRGADGTVRTVFFRDPDGILVQFDQR